MGRLWSSTIRFAASAILATAGLAAQSLNVGRPGMVNYAEGQVSVGNRSIAAKDLKRTEIEPGRVLQTHSGKAEVLLTPGVFLRLGSDSAVRMISSSLTDTRFELLHGEALVEVTQIKKENRLAVLNSGVTTQIENKGLYRFAAGQPMVSVLDGKAYALVDDHRVEVGKGKELDLKAEGDTLKPRKFDRNEMEQDDLYAWSKLRSEYLAQANQSSAQMILRSRPGWYGGTGWYWNPWFDTWAFVPGAGYMLSPFGYGFYSPRYVYYAPAYRTYVPGRVIGAPPASGGGGQTQPAQHPAAAGGSGVRFGGHAPAPAAAPAAPPPAPAPAPAPAAPAPAGGHGVRFGTPSGR